MVLVEQLIKLITYVLVYICLSILYAHTSSIFIQKHLAVIQKYEYLSVLGEYIWHHHFVCAVLVQSFTSFVILWWLVLRTFHCRHSLVDQGSLCVRGFDLIFASLFGAAFIVATLSWWPFEYRHHSLVNMFSFGEAAVPLVC